MSTGRFRVDPDIRRAHTPPGWMYSDPAVLTAARERVFAPSWQLVADTSRIKVPGQVYPFTLLEGLLDEPLLLTRDREDRVHCLSNVCTHRGTCVVEGAGVENVLRCRYHGRRFGLDGRFQFMPEFEGDRKSTRLNSSHTVISYAVFCLKKKKKTITSQHT